MVNEIHILGNLGAEPETRAVGNTNVTKIRVATTRKWKNKAGEPQSKTEWHTIELWDKLSDIASKYLHKGGQCHIIGSLEYDQYEKENVKITSAKIRARSLTLLGGKPSGETAQSAAPTQQKVQNDTEIDDLPF